MAISKQSYTDLKEYWDYQRLLEYNRELLKQRLSNHLANLFYSQHRADILNHSQCPFLMHFDITIFLKMGEDLVNLILYVFTKKRKPGTAPPTLPSLFLLCSLGDPAMCSQFAASRGQRTFPYIL